MKKTAKKPAAKQPPSAAKKSAKSTTRKDGAANPLPEPSPIVPRSESMGELIRIQRERMEWENAHRVADLALRLRPQGSTPDDASLYLERAASLLRGARLRMQSSGEQQGLAVFIEGMFSDPELRLSSVIRKTGCLGSDGKNQPALWGNALPYLKQKLRTVPAFFLYTPEAKPGEKTVDDPWAGRIFRLSLKGHPPIPWQICSQRNFNRVVERWAKDKAERELSEEWGPQEIPAEALETLKSEIASTLRRRARKHQLTVHEWLELARFREADHDTTPDAED
jgi:hypothetical protein